MSEQHLNNFWTKCEDRLKCYTNLFNFDMHSKGFKVQYKILEKNTYYGMLHHYYDLPATKCTMCRCPSFFYECYTRNCFKH